MSSHKDGQFDPDSVIKLCLLLAGIFFAPVTLYVCWLWIRNDTRALSPRSITLRFALTLGLICAWFLWLDLRYPMYPVFALHSPQLLGARVVWIWAVLLVWARLIYKIARAMKGIELGLRTSHFRSQSINMQEMRKLFLQAETLPLGVNVQDQSAMYLSTTHRTSHLFVMGATGMGKTNLMTNMTLHAAKHRQPCVIIDPKGEDSTLNEFIKHGRMCDPHFDKRFRLFSMSKPETSYQYNPLKHGNANQLKDRIMEALTWSEPYYESVSASFLTSLTALTEHLGVRLTLDRLAQILVQKRAQSELHTMAQDRFEAKDARAMELWNSLQSFFSHTKADALSGLHAQLSILNNPTFGHLLSFDSSKKEIDFRDIRKTNGIAYFQLDTLGNGDSARRLGRMIIEDLKSLASEVYKQEPKASERTFFPIFIDEFGSFASKEFIEFLKQCRGARFALHLFCQGLEDLDVVSPEFRRQIISNASTKISLRVDDRETVEEFCATAGTFDSVKQSYQISGEFGGQKTGMGNMREVKEMQIEHDVIKQLKIGQAVVVQKSPNRVCGIQICTAKDLI